MSDRLAAVRHFREQAGGRVPIMGWVEGALAEAADLRGVSTLLTDLYDRPEWVRELLEICTEMAIAFARAPGRGRRGHHRPGRRHRLADRAAGVPPVRPALRAAHLRGGPRAGRDPAAAHLRQHVAHPGRHGAERRGRSSTLIGWWTWARPRQAFGDGAAVCGNFDPVAVMLNGTPAQVQAAVRANLAAGGPRCISMAGCEIPDGTPHANLRAQAALLREWGGR